MARIFPLQLQLPRTKPETQKLVRVIPIKGVAISSQTVEEENHGKENLCRVCCWVSVPGTKEILNKYLLKEKIFSGSVFLFSRRNLVMQRRKTANFKKKALGFNVLPIGAGGFCCPPPSATLGGSCPFPSEP